MDDFTVLCPHCQARLTMSADLKAIVSSAPAEIPKTFASFDAALGALSVHDSERDAKFQASIDAEKSKKNVLEKKFEELIKKAKDDPSRPVRDIDLE